MGTTRRGGVEVPESQQRETGRPRSVTVTVTDVGDLVAVRRAVAQTAALVDLEPGRVGEFVIAVNEIVTNALIHGVPPATVTVVATETRIRVSVHDLGRLSVADPSGQHRHVREPIAAAPAPPTPDRPHGRGLWLAGRLTDQLHMRSGPDGTTVTLDVHLDQPHR
jgi:serine/threonine-protein kinase RsbW